MGKPTNSPTFGVSNHDCSFYHKVKRSIITCSQKIKDNRSLASFNILAPANWPPNSGKLSSAHLSFTIRDPTQVAVPKKVHSNDAARFGHILPGCCARRDSWCKWWLPGNCLVCLVSPVIMIRPRSKMHTQCWSDNSPKAKEMNNNLHLDMLWSARSIKPNRVKKCCLHLAWLD